MRHHHRRDCNLISSSIIAVELLEDKNWKKEQIISDNCFSQLISVINFAHDQGEKRVVIINHTDSFSNEALLKQLCNNENFASFLARRNERLPQIHSKKYEKSLYLIKQEFDVYEKHKSHLEKSRKESPNSPN